jgi:hypothetical protein
MMGCGNVGGDERSGMLPIAVTIEHWPNLLLKAVGAQFILVVATIPFPPKVPQ